MDTSPFAKAQYDGVGVYFRHYFGLKARSIQIEQIHRITTKIFKPLNANLWHKFFKRFKGLILLEKFLITHNNYEVILANPARLVEHNITKIYLRDRNLPIEIFHAFLELKNVEIFVNYSESPEILAHKNIHLKSNELHLAKSLKGVDCFDSTRGVESRNDKNSDTKSLKNCDSPKSTRILSYSAHSLSDILNAHSVKIDYIFISPIFAVPNKNQPLGIEFLAQIPCEIKPKIFALGGINSDNINAFENCGIAGIAGIRAFDKIFG